MLDLKVKGWHLMSGCEATLHCTVMRQGAGAFCGVCVWAHTMAQTLLEKSQHSVCMNHRGKTPSPGRLHANKSRDCTMHREPW